MKMSPTHWSNCCLQPDFSNQILFSLEVQKNLDFTLVVIFQEITLPSGEI